MNFGGFGEFGEFYTEIGFSSIVVVDQQVREDVAFCLISTPLNLSRG